MRHQPLRLKLVGSRDRVVGVAPSFAFFYLIIRRPPRPPLFPYTTLFRSLAGSSTPSVARTRDRARTPSSESPPRDRKSTRLNSSHVESSHAVVCLKKKKLPKWKSSALCK